MGVNYIKAMKSTIHLRSKWAKEEAERISSGKRRYLHFDYRITDVNRAAQRLTPGYVAGHSFYPFILREKKRRKYKKDPKTRKPRIHEKIRPIAYAAHYDALIYSWYGYLLSHYYEEKIALLGITDNVIAYRKLGKSNLDFANEIIEYIRAQAYPCHVICLDLEKFFDTLDHKLLKENWIDTISESKLPSDHYAVYKNITRFSYVNYDEILGELNIAREELRSLQRYCSPEEFRNLRSSVSGFVKKNPNIELRQGIPQGSTISAILSNVYMLGFDREIAKLASDMDGLYRRYSDDIIVIVPESSDVFALKEAMLRSVNKAKVSINDSKTEELIYEPLSSTSGKFLNAESKKPAYLQYLGVQFDGSNTLLRHSGIAAFQRKMKKIVRKFARKSQRAGRPFPKKRIYGRFFYSKESNYLAYAKRAANTLKSNAISRQVKKQKILKSIKNSIQKSSVKD